MTHLTMINQVSSHHGQNGTNKDVFEKEDGLSTQIYPVSPVFKTPLVEMKRERTQENLNELNMSDLFSEDLPQRKQEDGTIPASSNEIMWSPFHNSCLSPILSKKEHLKAVPESLEPLLTKDDISWTSSLATPRVHNHSWTHVNSGIKKTASEDNFDFLLSCDVSPSADCKRNEITNNSREAPLSRQFENSHKTSLPFCDNMVICGSTLTCVDKDNIVGSGSRQKSLSCSFQRCDGVAIEKLNHCDKRSFLKDSDKSVIARRLFYVPDVDSKETKICNNSFNEYLGINYDTAGKTSQFSKSTECIGSKEVLDETLCNLRTDSKNNVPTNYYNTQDFFNNLSFGTLDEVFQATEMIGSTDNSPVSNLPVDNFSEMVQMKENCNSKNVSEIFNATNKNLKMNRTSTPLNVSNKRVHSCKEINRKKIKFVADLEGAPSYAGVLEFQTHSKGDGSHFFSQDLSKIVSHEVTSTETLQCAQNLTPCTKINSIKKFASKAKNFVYAHSTTKYTEVRNSVFDIADVLREAQALEDGEILDMKAGVLSSESKKRLENSYKEYRNCNFVSFSRLCKDDDSDISLVEAPETCNRDLKKVKLEPTDVYNTGAVEYQSNVEKDFKIKVYDNSYQLNIKSNEKSPILVSSCSKRVQNENSGLYEFNAQKFDDTHDHSANNNCNSRTYQGTKLPYMKQEKSVSSFVDLHKSAAMDAADSFECQKLRLSKEVVDTVDVGILHDEEQVAVQEIKKDGEKVESNFSDTNNMSIMDVTDTQLIAAGESTGVLSHLQELEGCSQRQSRFVKQDSHNRKENEVRVAKTIPVVDSKITLETKEIKRKRKQFFSENYVKSNRTPDDSCSENYENLLDLDTVDQLFEDSSDIGRTNSHEIETFFPCKNIDSESKTNCEVSKELLMINNIFNNGKEKLSKQHLLIDSKQTDDGCKNLGVNSTSGTEIAVQGIKELSPEECINLSCKLKSDVSGQVTVGNEIHLERQKEDDVPNGIKFSFDSDIKNKAEILMEVLIKQKFSNKKSNHELIDNSKISENEDFGFSFADGKKLIVKDNIIQHVSKNYRYNTITEKVLELSNGKLVDQGTGKHFTWTDSTKKTVSKLTLENEENFVTDKNLFTERSTQSLLHAAVKNKFGVSKKKLDNELIIFTENSLLDTTYTKEIINDSDHHNHIKKVQPIFSETSSNHGIHSTSEETRRISIEPIIQVKSVLSETNVSETRVANLGYTASRKKMWVTEQALKKAESLLLDEGTYVPVLKNNVFSTDSGEEVDVTGQAMKKAKELFSEESVTEPSIVNCGFSTASGKKVKVTEQAMKMAKERFSEESVTEPSIVNCGFSTASGKKVGVTEQSVKKAKELFSKESIAEPSIVNCGFSTASGKKVGVTEEAMKRAKELFSEESARELSNTNFGFSTASGKKVRVTEKAMKREKELFSKESVTEPIIANCGFSTASGKKVGVTKKAMKRAKELFSEESIVEQRIGSYGFSTSSGKKVGMTEQSMKKAKELFSEEGVTKSSILNCGFSTASGKKVGVTEEAMKRAKELFSEESARELSNTNFGFSTASGKEVRVTETAMKRAKELFSKESVTEPIIANCGFSTASGKKVGVTEEAMKREKELFSEESVRELSIANCGFSKDSGNKVGVTKQSMKKAKELFSEESVTELIIANCGFSTASGKKVGVTEEAMKRAKELFSEESVRELSIANCGFSKDSGNKVGMTKQSMKKAKELFSEESVTEPIIANCGFSTASGKKVGVTEEAMKRAKELFSEESVRELSIANCGFSKDSGNKVGMTKQSMKKAKELFSEESVTEPIIANCGFSTAGGKKVGVTEEAMKRAKELFSEESVRELSIANCGFSKDSGNKVGMTKQSMKKAKELFSEESVTEPIIANCGFSTASGKKVGVTEEAMKRAKDLFSEESVREQSIANCGLSTASRKKVGVTEHCTKKAKELFSEDGKVEHVIENCGLSTVRGKKVEVSKQAMKKAVSLVLDEESPKQIVTNFLKSPISRQKFQNNTTMQHGNNLILKYDNAIDDEETEDRNFLVAKQCAAVEEEKYSNNHNNNNFFKTPLNEVEKSNPISLDCDSPLVEICTQLPVVVDNGCDKYLNCDISEAVICDAASIHDCLVGIEAMHSHSKTSGSLYKVDSDDNIVKSPVLQRKRCFVNTCSPSSPVLKSNFSAEPKKCKFPCTGNENATVNFDVTSQADASRWCKWINFDHSKLTSDMSGNVCEITEVTSEMSLSREGNGELKDKLDVPHWASSFITCPDSSGDRFDAPKPVVSSDAGDVIPSTQYALGSHDRFHSRQFSESLRCKTKLSFSSSKTLSPVPRLQLSTTKKSVFKVPYKDAGQVGCAVLPSAIQPLRNTAKKLAYGTPFSKRLKVSTFDQETKASSDLNSSAADVAADRTKAARKQEVQINSVKKEYETGPCKGSHLLRKIQTRELQRTWREVAAGKLPGMYTKEQLLQLAIKEDVRTLSAANAAEYRFSAWNFYSPEVCRTNTSGIAVGDGAVLVLDAAGFAGVEEFARAFLSSPGVDPSLLPSNRWVANHYRWIVWKLASTDRSFPSLFTSRCLTPNNVMLQLKYRYDREIDRSERSALSRILQRDDAAAKRLVLCVADISKHINAISKDTGSYELELSDGWYSVKATVDHEMCRLIKAKVVTIGTKLITYGAELLNCDQGCLPLEAGSEVRLRLHTNSTRRARWYIKLGYHSCPGPLSVSLTSLLPLGGLVSCVTVVVARVYPQLYMQKETNGKSVFRNERMEERAAAQFERVRQEMVERVLSQVQAQLKQECASKSKPTLLKHSAGKVTSQMTGEDLCQLLESASDPASLQALLSTEQQEAVMMYQEQHHEDMRRELESRMRDQLQDVTRTVIPLLKIRCTDAINLESKKYATLSIWRASDDVAGLLREGAVIKLFNVTANGNRYKDAELQLSASKQTVFQPILRSVNYPQRKVTHLSEVSKKDFCPPFWEVDVVGVVVCTTCSAAGCDEVYLASEDCAFICVVFKGGVKEFGFEDILAPQNKVAASNLQWRLESSPEHIPRAFAWECSSFCLHPRSRHLQDALKLLTQRLTGDMKQFVSHCKEKVNFHQQQKMTLGIAPCNEVVVHKRYEQMSKSHAPEMTDGVRPPSSAERKIIKLELYGEPPPLSPLVLPRPQGTLRRQFRAPVKIVAQCKQSPHSSDSPPLSLESQDEDQ